jgi:hypothetical protein
MIRKAVLIGLSTLLIGGILYVFLGGQRASAPPMMTLAAVEKPPPHPPPDAGAQTSNEALGQGIASLAKADSTRYSIYICYPKEDRPAYIYQPAAMRSASMIKVFILGAAMEKIRDGQFSLDQTIILHAQDKVGGAGVLTHYADGSELSLDTLLRLMITESDNTATNMVIDLLGMESINDYIRRGGYADTVLQRKMMDMDAVFAGRDNYTSAPDLGHFFQKLYHHTCVSSALDAHMLAYLKEQSDTECFPTALPEATIAHKTGELTRLYDDGGIIYMQNRDFIMIGMTENYTSRSKAIDTLRRMVRCAAEN